MLSVHHLSKSYGIQPVLQDITFNISNRERVGLIGPNGCGKSTLMRILAGVEAADSGSARATRPGLRVGYLAQGLEPDPAATIHSALRQAQGNALASASVDEAALEAEIASLAATIARNPNDSALQAKYDSALAHLSSSHFPLATVLTPLGLSELPLDTPVTHLSGGQKTRLMLAKLLLAEPHLLLLDEPTNHLDIRMLEWLEEWLTNFNGAALIVSHDRTFLDKTVNRVFELDATTHGLRVYDGNYSDYADQKEHEREQQLQAYQDQQEELAHLRAAATHLRGLTKMKKGGKADGGDKFAQGFFGNRATKRVAGKAKHIEARIEKILTEDKLEKPGRTRDIKLGFSKSNHQSKDVLITKNLAIGYNNTALLKDLNLHIRAGQRIALTGENGCGKTTLLRTIAGRLNPLSGSVKLGASVRLGYMTQEQERIEPEQSPLEHIQRVSSMTQTEARAFLHFFLFTGDHSLRPAGEMSYGERARLMLALLVAEGCNFLLLDEPVNHLDIPSRARFEEALRQFEGTVLAVIHDRYFIERFAEDVWLVEDGHVRVL